MGNFIVKCARDEDLYFEWSSIADGITFVGSREGLVAYLQEPKRYFRGDTMIAGPASIEERVSRADERGDSARDVSLGWDPEGILIYEQRGMLRRRNFTAFCRLILEHEDHELGMDDEHWNALMDLLEPFDSGENEPVDRSRR